MGRAQKMLEVLQDGRPHTRRDLFDHCGFFLTNNAASELRALGHDVRQSSERVDGQTVYSYQWVGSLPEPGNARVETETSPRKPHAPGSESEPEQLRLSEVA